MHPAIIIGIVRSLIVDVAMGQIPRSTERISSFHIIFKKNFWLSRAFQLDPYHDSIMRFRSFNKRNINTLVTVTVTPGLYPWTPLRDFRPQIPNLPTPGKKILRAPTD